MPPPITLTSPLPPARAAVDLHAEDIGRPVVLTFEHGDIARPVVMAVLREGEGVAPRHSPGVSRSMPTASVC